MRPEHLTEHLNEWPPMVRECSIHLAQSSVADAFVAPTNNHRAALRFDVEFVNLYELILPRPELLRGVRERLIALALCLHGMSRSHEAIFADESAAWAYAGGSLPPRIAVVTSSRGTIPPHIKGRKIHVPPSDIATIMGIRVLSPARTFVELMRGEHEHPRRYWARRLVEHGWVSAHDMRMMAHQRRQAQRSPQAGDDYRYRHARHYLRLARDIERLERRLATA